MNENYGKPKRSFLPLLVGAVLVVSVLNLFLTFSLDGKLNSVTGGVVINQPSGDLREVNPQPSADQPRQQPPSKVDVSIDDDTIKGPEDAPITIIEFSDYECPFCVRAEPTLDKIFEEYPDKIRLVYRDFPLGFHTNAQKAAEATECAGEQDKFWEMHDKLFDEGVEGGVISFKQFADDLGLDTQEFDSCLDSGEMESEVQKDMSDGQSAGVTGTPAFFINGVKLVGAQPFESFKEIIDRELE